MIATLFFKSFAASLLMTHVDLNFLARSGWELQFAQRSETGTTIRRRQSDKLIMTFVELVQLRARSCDSSNACSYSE